MFLRFYVLFLFLFFALQMSAQQKQIVGDTAYWFSPETQFAKKIELRDLSNLTNSYEFRFSNGEQFVEIWQSGDTLAGVLTNYTMKLGKKYEDPDIDTFFNKVILPREDLEKIKSLLDENRIAEMPNEDEIEGWGMGFDGITYRFQFSTPEKLINNSYWTPEFYDTLPEARKILFAVDSITNLFNLENEYENLFKTFPKRGTFGTHNAYYRIFPNGGKTLGYFGSLKMPIGISFSSYVRYVKKLKTDFSFDITGRLNREKDYNLDFSLRKLKVFFKNNEKVNGSILFLGRERRIQTVDFGEKIRASNLAYLFSFPKKGIGLGIGASHVFRPETQTGIYFSPSYHWAKIDCYLGSRLSFFSDRMDYYFYLQKDFKFHFWNDNLFVKLLVFSERFRGFSDTGLGVSVLLF